MAERHLNSISTGGNKYNVNDVPELVDIRLGADGTEYESAGEAVRGQIGQIEGTLITDTASGSIASFSDGSDGINVRDLRVNVEPVQDLHGYSNPWPAGGNINQLPPPTNATKTANGITIKVENGVYTITGTATATAEIIFDLPTDVSITTAQKTAFLNDSANSGVVFYYRYNYTNKSEYGMGGNTNRIWEHGGDLSPVNKIRFIVSNGTAVGTMHLSPMLMDKSLPNPTSFSPYSNICPITGWENVKVTRTGKNIFSAQGGTTYTNAGLTYTRNTDGSITISGTATLRADLNLGVFRSGSGENTFSVKAGTYRISVTGFVPGMEYICGGANGTSGMTYLSLTSSSSSATRTVTKDGTTGYNMLRIASGTAITTPITVYIQWELGSTATAYEPYQGTTITIPLGSTVYGGTLDVTSGVLKVDRAIVHATDRISTSVGTSGAGIKYADIKINMNMVADAEACCDYYKWISQATTGADGTFQTYATIITIYDNRFTNKTTAESILNSENATFIVKIPTPITVQLTPQQTTTLLGQNNIFADAGDVDVDYIADTKLYIAKMIANALNA